MKRASLVAVFASFLVFDSAPGGVGSVATGVAGDDAGAAEERLLGSADDQARFEAYQIFTREIAADGAVGESLDASLAEARVPAAALLDAREALAGSLDLARDVRRDDRFYVRYEQAFTAEGAPVDVGRVLWMEVRTKAKGTVAIYRYRSRDRSEHFWLANGQPATPPSMRMPLDVI